MGKPRKMRLNAMGKRSVATVAVFTVLIGLLTATPALATYSIYSILFPNGATTFYSPFPGPADIEIRFDDVGPIYDPPATLTLRLRYKDGATIYSDTVNVDPNPDQSPMTVQFGWPALTVRSTTKYEVAVYRGARSSESEPSRSSRGS